MLQRLLSWRKKRGTLVRERLLAHMGRPCDDAQTITHVIKPIERVNLQLALDRWVERDGGPRALLGYSSLGGYFRTPGLSQILRDDDVVQSPVEREQFEKAPGEMLDCVTAGLYLLHHGQEPVAVLVRPAGSSLDQPSLEVLALRREVVQTALADLLEEVNRSSVYKGKTIYLEAEDYPRQVHIRFRPLPPTPRESIVLPENVLRVIERNVIGLFRHAEVLRRSGRSTRHGLLFHGAPGTGKTLMLRYLAQACPDHTVILMTGRQVGLIRESCQVARLLAPSLVILEDVDLIGEDRSRNDCPTLLHELMDEMDGLGTRADCVFLLTTNRPEVLESALASRPGRIDQAVEFPLPDDDCRRRLFGLYGKGLDLAKLDLPRWVEKTHGVSPAFIEELLRKGALMAAERGETADPLPVTDDDLDSAANELILFGGELTQKLLGYRPGIGYRSPGTGN